MRILPQRLVLETLKGENIVQTIAFDRIPNGNIMKEIILDLVKFGQDQICL